MRRIFEILGVGLLLVITWQVQSRFFPTIETEVRTDTTYIDRPYEVEVIKEVEVPKEVVVYETVVDTIRDVRVETDTVYVTTDTQDLKYGTPFFTQYPTAPKFLGLHISRDEISFTGQRRFGSVQTSTWDFDPRFDYRFGLDNKGWIAIERDRKGRGTFDHSIGVGYLYGYYQSPYVEYRPSFSLYGIDINGKLLLSNQPVGGIGINIEL